jgi:hypothetical protein
MGLGRQLAAIVSLVFLTACGTSVTTSVPIGTTAGVGPDKALYGTWKGHFVNDFKKDDGRDSFVHFLRSGDTDTDVIWVSAPRQGDDSGSNERYKITTAKLGDNHYINAVQPREGSDDVSDNIPVLYRWGTNGTLTLCLMDLDKTVATIKAGTLPGVFVTTVGKDKSGKVETRFYSAQINAEASELDAFMAKPEAADLFEAFLVLKRVE